MKINDYSEIESLKNEYPIGTRIILLKMDDVQAPPKGTRGTVLGVDDMGSILVRWDSGSSLNIIPKIDTFQKVDQND
ncbi:MAG: DUF4314 domain-containing protein [Acholeplasmataceae bacterium]